MHVYLKLSGIDRERLSVVFHVEEGLAREFHGALCLALRYRVGQRGVRIELERRAVGQPVLLCFGGVVGQSERRHIGKLAIKSEAYDEQQHGRCHPQWAELEAQGRDRKSTRLNSSHANISYAVFCLK